jgi:malate dehydrogenase (quinone)
MTFDYDLIVNGLGIGGSSAAFVASRYSGFNKILTIEKYSQFAQVNSKSSMNSQTRHTGEIETNMSLETALNVRAAALHNDRYIERFGHDKLATRYRGMLLGVGDDEVAFLKKRHAEFAPHFPRLQYASSGEVAELEPNILEGRKASETVAALHTDQGLAIDYGAVATDMMQHAQGTGKVDVSLDTRVHRILREGHGFRVITSKGDYTTRALLVECGGHSLLFAKQLGYGHQYTIIPVGGSFYFARKRLLNGKVYTVQDPDLPFAAIHGDPEVHDVNLTRFGPTAKLVAMLERYDPGSFVDFFRASRFDVKTLKTLLRIATHPVQGPFMLRNLFYDWPLGIGSHLFAKQVRKIIPSIEASDLQFAHGVGGLRPQIVDVNEGSLKHGETKIAKPGVIFSMTPSPGATKGLKNGIDDVRTLALEAGLSFDDALLERELGESSSLYAPATLR